MCFNGITILIPALNEELTIGYTIDQIPFEELTSKGFRVEIIVVNNGSDDRTADIARDKGALVINESRKGYGNAYRRGIINIKGDIVVMVDGDGTYPLQNVHALINPILSGKVDAVLGSRFKGTIHPGAMTPLRKFGNRLLTYHLNLLFRAKTSDAHSGFRSFKTSALKKMALNSPGMEFATELVIEATKNKLRVVEIPIEYFPRPKASESKLHAMKDGLRHVIYMWRRKLSV